MGNVVTANLLVDGHARTTIEVVGVLDTSDLVNFVAADVASLFVVDQGSKAKASGLGIERIDYSIQDGLSVQIYFEATPNDLINSLVGRGKQDYKPEGFRYCMNSAKTGRILINTNGFVATGNFTFNLKLTMRKQTQ